MSTAVSRVGTHSDSGRRPPNAQPIEPEDGRQNLVLPDPIAFRLLREDSCTEVVESQAVVEGFELYIVEQWACSRTQPTSVIVTFTGLPQHKVLAGVLSLPKDEDEWSDTLRSYLDAVTASHARHRDTPQGMLMVTNLSNFPSALTVIPVPEGDVKTYRESFIVNEDLKKLGCSGRAGLTLAPPTNATTEKFRQQYYTHEAVPVSESVIALVKFCQTALILFDVLAPLYVDGLLCDMTESAISNWWTKFGTEYYSIEPNEEVLGPTTVSALLGLYMGARNRLNSSGGPTVKNAFDPNAMERAISYFQRTQRLSGAKNGRLDRQTLDSLHRSTSKAAYSDRWLVPRAVKSTVAEFGGKGGEMVMGMVGRDKAGIAEIETLDIRKFSEVVSGRHARWLWQGRSKKPDSVDIFTAAIKEDDVFSGDETDNKSSRKRPPDVKEKFRSPTVTDPFYSNPLQGSASSLDALDKDPALRKNVLKSMTGRMSEARSGIGRFKEAMGRTTLRSSNPKSSQQGSIQSPVKTQQGRTPDETIKPLPFQFPSRRSFEKRAEPPARMGSHANLSPPMLEGSGSRDFADGTSAQSASWTGLSDTKSEIRKEVISKRTSSDPLEEASVDNFETESKVRLEAGGEETAEVVRASQSFDDLRQRSEAALRVLRSALPRQMSTSAMELERQEDGALTTSEQSGAIAVNAIADEYIHSTQNASLSERMDRLGTVLQPYTKDNLQELERLAVSLEHERVGLEYQYAEKINEHRALQEGTTDLLQEEEAFLTETLRELEVLGARLEYELSTLVSKVEDVEDGVVDFEHQVQDLEARLEMLGRAEQKPRPWPLRVLGL